MITTILVPGAPWPAYGTAHSAGFTQRAARYARVGGKARKGKNLAAIADYLQTNHLPTKDVIAADLGIAESSVRQALTAMRIRGVVTSTQIGIYPNKIPMMGWSLVNKEVLK